MDPICRFRLLKGDDCSFDGIDLPESGRQVRRNGAKVQRRADRQWQRMRVFGEFALSLSCFCTSCGASP
jgi:hypothetical protein